MPVSKAPASPEPKPRLRHLNGEIFYSLAEAKVIIEAWRRYYNTERPHSSLGYKPPAPEAIIWPAPPRGSGTAICTGDGRKAPSCTKNKTGPPYGGRPSGHSSSTTRSAQASSISLSAPTTFSEALQQLPSAASYRLSFPDPLHRSCGTLRTEPSLRAAATASNILYDHDGSGAVLPVLRAELRRWLLSRSRRGETWAMPATARRTPHFASRRRSARRRPTRSTPSDKPLTTPAPQD